MLDLTKPIRFITGGNLSKAYYAGKIGRDNHLFAWYSEVRSTWIAEVYTDAQLAQRFENIPERKESHHLIYRGDWVDVSTGYWTIEALNHHQVKERTRAKGLLKITWEGDVPIQVELVKD